MFITHLVSSVFCLILRLLLCILSEYRVSILVRAYPKDSKQTLLCNKHNVSNLISSHNPDKSTFLMLRMNDLRLRERSLNTLYVLIG